MDLFENLIPRTRNHQLARDGGCRDCEGACCLNSGRLSSQMLRAGDRFQAATRHSDTTFRGGLLKMNFARAQMLHGVHCLFDLNRNILMPRRLI
jgi:hypothetical protein